jgi:hypothetical protein
LRTDANVGQVYNRAIGPDGTQGDMNSGAGTIFIKIAPGDTLRTQPEFS